MLKISSNKEELVQLLKSTKKFTKIDMDGNFMALFSSKNDRITVADIFLLFLN